MAKKLEIGNKRIIGFAGHSGCGKTSLCEAMLWLVKATDRIGRVDQQTAAMDFEPEEHKRLYSVSSSTNDIVYKNTQFFMLDTPGSSDFIPEAKITLTVAGGVVMPIDAVDGPKHQHGILKEFCEERNLPMMLFVNKLDKERAKVNETLAAVKEQLGIDPVLLQLPIGQEDSFKGVVDLLEKQAYVYADDSGKAEKTDIPSDMADAVEEARETMIERLVEGDEEVMEKYLEGEEVTSEELYKCLKKGTLSGELVPALVGSAYKNIGVDRLLEALKAAFPAPNEEAPRKMVDLDSGEELEDTVQISEDGPFLGYVFKTLADPFGTVYYLRVMNGKLASDDDFVNVNRNSKERMGKLFYMRGKKHDSVDEVGAGEIVAVSKMKDMKTGDTLAAAKQNAVLAPLPEAIQMMTFAIYAKKKGEEEKMGQAINRLLEEDPTLKMERQEQTKELLLSVVGQAHLDVTIEKIARRFKVEIDFRVPKVPYRETIRGRCEVEGKHKKQSGGRGQFGVCWIRVSPKPRGEGFEFVNCIVGGAIPKQYIPAVEKGIVDTMMTGDLSGNPVQDVQIELFDGKYHDVDSSEMAFKIAGSLAWKTAFEKSEPVLLEPYINVLVKVPSEHMGDVIGELNSRRGRVQGMEEAGRYAEVSAQSPQAEMHDFSQTLRSMTQDRAIFTTEFSHYEEAPPDVMKKVVEEYQRSKEEE